MAFVNFSFGARENFTSPPRKHVFPKIIPSKIAGKAELVLGS
jgi:hypothetical protein